MIHVLTFSTGAESFFMHGGRQGEGVTVAFHIQGLAKECLKLAEPLY